MWGGGGGREYAYTTTWAASADDISKEILGTTARAARPGISRSASAHLATLRRTDEPSGAPVGLPAYLRRRAVSNTAVKDRAKRARSWGENQADGLRSPRYRGRFPRTLGASAKKRPLESGGQGREGAMTSMR